MTIKKLTRTILTTEAMIIAYLAIAKILFHLLHPEYGYFRDEFFYIAIADQFSFGNLDVLPLTPLYLKLITAIFGYSIKAIHFASALPGALSMVLVCLITKELGGKKYAILLTGMMVFFSGFLIFGALFTYDSLDFLINVLVLFLLVKLFKGNDQKLWLWIGLVLGLGLLNKLTTLIWGLGIFTSLWMVPQRAWFKEKWIWIGGITALLFSLPFVIWQSQHQWYFLEVAASYSGGIAYVASLPEYIWGQILPNNIFSFPVWAAGLGLLLFSKKWRNYRFFGFLYVLLFWILFIIGAKFYFLIPIYTTLFAVGTIRIEEYFLKRESGKQSRRILKRALPVGYLLLSMLLLPLAVPILPIESMVKFAAVFGVDAGVKTENAQMNQLPQHIADRFGWPEMVDQVAEIYNHEIEVIGKPVGILTDNWGQAAAIHLLGQKYNLPEPVSLHGWYYFETLRTHSFLNSYITIGLSKGNLETIFSEVTDLGVFSHRYCVPFENNKPIFLCRDPKYDLRQFWMVQYNMDPHFIELLQTKGTTSAIAFYREMIKMNPKTLLFSERQINALGYEYLAEGKTGDAFAMFHLNVEVFPSAFNVYDSLGEAYMLDGQYAKAIENYKRSLELNPKNSNAEDKLIEIEVLQQ